jgi:hypothetical protein
MNGNYLLKSVFKALKIDEDWFFFREKNEKKMKKN